MLIILRPGFGSDSLVEQIAQLAVIVSAVFWAVSLVLTRHLTASENSTTIVIYYLGVGAFISGLLTPINWTTPTLPDWLLMISLGIASAVSQFMITEAYRRAPASLVSPFFYATLIWTTMIGYVIWGEIPDRFVIAGSLILFVSGAYLALFGSPREAASRVEEAKP
jgi:drug/metabolite transporter (DMT)-like permease